MPKKIQKSLQDYLSKIKSPHPQIQLPFNSLSSSRNWLLSGCKHPKTPSFAIDGRNAARGSGGGGGGGVGGGGGNNHKNDAATLADVDRFLLENFKSLYVKDGEETENNTKRVSEESHGEAPKLGPILFDSPRFVEPPRDLCGSNRFFVKPGFSGSLLEDALTSMTTTCDETRSSSTSTTTLNDSSSSNFLEHRRAEKEGEYQALPDNCVALLTYSPSPYEDFRRSMQDVVDARSRNHERVDWDFMEELLFCYLNLNEKKSYKFILSAFVDLVVVLRRHSETAPAQAKPRSVRTVRVGGEVKKKTKEVTLKFRSS